MSDYFEQPCSYLILFDIGYYKIDVVFICILLKTTTRIESIKEEINLWLHQYKIHSRKVNLFYKYDSSSGGSHCTPFGVGG